ncbi:putative ergosterol biosynthesis ERG4/ERG24 family protein [Lyophyllum shimeji]|uniref:Protein-S-isoprenylcysteine O-methyltransferase n=1 Tax=Lyophyllum shimeji TaxID=47721 RepID=A0A9P3UWM0_LYOSH|nr:putative ergosterol biosynthesis ERG4/ERG24 family protein [Lyophyllum shimeji]
MSLLKIPLLASMVWGLHTTMTPPNPPPAANERLPPTGLEHIATTFPYIPKVRGHQAAQVLFWTASLAEIVVIIANHVPAHSLSQQALRLLVHTDSHPVPPDLRITVPFLIGWSLAIPGSLLRQQCYRTLGSQFTFQLGVSRKHRLVTHGPYAHVRHPSYTGALLCLVGGLLCLLAPGAWTRECSGLWNGSRGRVSAGVLWGVLVLGAVVVARAVTGRMEREDAMLRERFGKEWERWAREVPWKLVPGIY